ncbi:MAG: PAS domain S-box protein [Methanoregula sp.]|nr:PAS domain S-box protein [Methanoregula sp.]
MYTVLYVDDEPDLLVVGQQFLERSPEFRVVPLTSAPEALASEEIRNCDAIVSDYQMPDMDGIAFLKAVREQHGDIPFILFTGRGREEIVIQAINNGADFYLQKGGDAKAQFAELEHKIRQAVARRQAEHSLVESEKRLADIINFLPDPTFAIDREGRIIAWNRAIVEMTGASASEMLGRGDHEYTVPFYGDHRPALIDMVSEPDEVLSQHYTHLSRDRGVLTGETSIVSPGGRPRILMATARPLYDRQGGIAGAIESLRDISGVRAAEEALRASEEKYRLVVEHSQDAVYIHRSDHVLFANNRASELTGYTNDELMAIRLWELVHPDDRAPLMENAQKRFAGEEVPSGFTARLIMKDGRERPCEFFVDLVMYQGAPAIIGIARDITVRKEAEDSLRASETRFRELAELLPQIVFEMDKDFRITYANRHAHTFTGVTPEDLARGYTALDLIAPGDHGRARENIRKIILGEVVDHHEYKMIRRDGTSFSALIYAAPILNNGDLTGFRGQIVDVSDRKRTEEALRISEERLHMALEASNNGLFDWDMAADKTYVSPQYYEMLGYAPGERTEQYETWFSQVHPDDAPLISRIISEYRDGRRGDHEMEFRLRTKDGGWKWILGRAKITLRDPEGKPLRMVGIYKDITGRKLAEHTLQESESYLRLITENMADLISRINADRTITYVSPSIERLLGYRSSDLVGQLVTRYLHPDDTWRVLQETHAAIGQHLPTVRLEYRYLHHNGEYRWIESETRILYDDDGEYDGMILSSRDISDRKRVEAALRESEDKYRHILVNLQDAYFRMDRDGVITMANPSAARIYGYRSPDEMIGMSISSLFRDPAQRAQVKEFLDKNGKVSDLTGEGRRKDGSFFWVSISVQYLMDSGEHVIGTEAIARDISERKVMEHAVHEANRKLNLLNNITRHDVTNQLTALQGYVQLAEIKKPDPVVMDYLHRIGEAAGTIERQITFTRDYQELGVHAPSWSALDKVVAKASGTTVPVRVSGTCRSVSVLADPMLERVFFNLFENAVRHGRSVTGITVRCEREPDGLLVIVEDDGVGIKPHEKEKIFTKGYGKNTGFGLFLSKEILAITGITIHETGTFGKGARFEMLVPKGAFRLPDKKGKNA